MKTIEIKSVILVVEEIAAVAYHNALIGSSGILIIYLKGNAQPLQVPGGEMSDYTQLKAALA